MSALYASQSVNTLQALNERIRRHMWISLIRAGLSADDVDGSGNVVCLRRMNDGQILGRIQYSPRRGMLVGLCLSVIIGAALYPFRHYDYELEFLLVLPVVYAGVFGGSNAAVVTSFVSVVTFHIVTRTGSSKVEEDILAFVTFLGCALAIGAAVGGGVDRLTLAKEREQEQARLRLLNDQIAEHSTRMAVLEQVDQQRAALLRSVSHDLRTPLATIRAVATDLRDSDLHDDETRQELLKSVSDEAERLDRLVGNLLSMSRIEAGSLRIEDQAVDLAELLQLTVLRLAPSYPEVHVEVEIDPALPLITGDPVLLDEVITNLLENAARYAAVDSTVSVQLTCADTNKVKLRVCDHGPGIGPEHSGHVFQAFWRGPDSRSSGLGLTIVKAIVEAHGGSIDLVDTPGGGATFEVNLAAREAARS
jgi:K+-sensing histidine kinase KdpD